MNTTLFSAFSRLCNETKYKFNYNIFSFSNQGFLFFFVFHQLLLLSFRWKELEDFFFPFFFFFGRGAAVKDIPRNDNDNHVKEKKMGVREPEISIKSQALAPTTTLGNTKEEEGNVIG